MKEKYPKRMFFENYEYISKQPLIKFLEDKINICDGVIDTTKSDLQETQFTFNCKKALEDTLKENELAKKIFQEILDFVNKGGKNE